MLQHFPNLGRRRSQPLMVEILEARALLAGSLDFALGDFALFTDAAKTTPGLMGSYINQSLRARSLQDDWRQSQTIAGTRTDATINFLGSSWGSRSTVGLTGGNDADWNNFSVQWDGYVEISAATALKIASDDGSRMWIDLDNNGTFGTAAPELLDNGWGFGQAPTTSAPTPVLQPGLYRLRIQYEEGNGGNVMQLLTNAPEMLRVVYLIPSNRTPQDGAVANMQYAVRQYQAWYSEQMTRYGFGPKTFRYETMADGVTPLIHVVNVEETDDYLGEDLWNRNIAAAQKAGVPLWSSGQLWWVVSESHIQHPDGTITGHTALGSGGSGSDGGVGMTASDPLSLFTPASLTDDRVLEGLTIPAIGPYPLNRENNQETVSDYASGEMGAVLHELTHGLGLGHDMRNDSNYNGDLMGNGLRGFRNFLFPDRYPQNGTRLGYGEALVLNVSRYLNPDDDSGDATKPVIGETPTGTVSPTGGLLPITFTASDASGLTGALLYRNGDIVEEVPLSGTSVASTFRTSYYEPGVENTFSLAVYDIHGNRQNADVKITPATGFNRAPRPFVKIPHAAVEPGQSVVLDAGSSVDPEGSTLTVEWDLDGDGTFDTAPTTQLSRTVSFNTSGIRLIRARLTDTLGAQTFSTPIPLEVRDAGDVEFMLSDFRVSENGRKATIFVQRTGGSDGQISVHFATSNGTARSGNDYFAAAGTLTWGDGDSATKSFVVTLRDDRLAEKDEIVNLILSNVTGGANLGDTSTAILTLLDNDSSKRRVFFQAASIGGSEGTTPGRVNVLLSSPSPVVVTVQYAVIAGTATGNGVDYTLVGTGRITFQPGQTRKSLFLSVINDALDEPNEEIQIRLFNPARAFLGATTVTTFTIVDNE